MRQFVLYFVALVSSVSAQEPVYVNPLAANPPYYRVRYEGSTQSGELVYPASFTVGFRPTSRLCAG